MVYRDFKDLARRTASDKVLHNRTFNIAKNPKYGGYQRGLASMIWKFFDKKFSWRSGFSIKQNQHIAEELHKPIIKKSKNIKYIHHLKTIFWVLILQIRN